MKKFLIPIGIFVLLGLLLWRGLSLDPRKIPSPLIGKPLPRSILKSVYSGIEVWWKYNAT